ncbi:MAG: MgtC/SapB family protein [Verrucomicrobia bacterium]|nr:MgtC/SapB family protein [Verrucomicrobiota bacterium]
MSTTIGWPEILLRLALTVAAGALIGVNRGEHGQTAGLRTTLLVCLAASLSMILANRLLGTTGKAPDSFTAMDVMRLPLGILSGMGFIGAGAIVRKETLVLGLTTAATLWFVTVMGLCFGGGQLGLGLAVTALAAAVLWGLKWIERRWKQDRHATLVVTMTADGPTEDDLASHLGTYGYRITAWAVTFYGDQQRQRELNCDVRWRAYPEDARPPAFLKSLAEQPGVLKLAWKP